MEFFMTKTGREKSLKSVVGKNYEFVDSTTNLYPKVALKDNDY
jgi:hypothetical protein